MKSTELDTRARALHEWFCQVTGQQLPLRMELLTRWIDWLQAGHNGPQLKTVLLYLRKQIASNKRNPGALKLSSLLDITKFEEDLGLAQSARSAFADPESRLPAPPDGATRTAKVASSAGKSSAPTRSAAEIARSAAALAELKRAAQ